MLEPIYNTLVLSNVSYITKADVERAISTCGWEINILATFSNNPVALLIPEAFEDNLALLKPPKRKKQAFQIQNRVAAHIFIEPMNDKSLSSFWLPFSRNKLVYSYHPELFPRIL